MSGAVPPTVDTHAGAGGGAGAGAGAFTPTPTGHHRRSSSNSPAVHNPDAGRKGKPAHLFHDKVLFGCVACHTDAAVVATGHCHCPLTPPSPPPHLGTDGVPCGHSPPSYQGRARQSHEDPTVLRGLQCGLPRTALARQPCEGGWGLDLPGYWYYSLLQVPGKCVYVCDWKRRGRGERTHMVVEARLLGADATLYPHCCRNTWHCCTLSSRCWRCLPWSSTAWAASWMQRASSALSGKSVCVSFRHRKGLTRHHNPRAMHAHTQWHHDWQPGRI